MIDTVYDYMDINKHQMGEDIFVGDLEKDISKIDGEGSKVICKD